MGAIAARPCRSPMSPAAARRRLLLPRSGDVRFQPAEDALYTALMSRELGITAGALDHAGVGECWRPSGRQCRPGEPDLFRRGTDRHGRDVYVRHGRHGVALQVVLLGGGCWWVCPWAW